MSLDKDQFDAGFFPIGILLCMLCILLWALCVYKDAGQLVTTDDRYHMTPRLSSGSAGMYKA